MLGVSVAQAADSSSNGTINVIAEYTQKNFSLLSGAEADVNNTALTVNTDYHINFTVMDVDGMDDITNITVRVWNSADGATENSSDDQNNHYSFLWTPVDGLWSCTGPDAGFYKSGIGSNSSAITQYVFQLEFDLSKVATYANGGTYTAWRASAFGYDTEDSFDHDNVLCFGVAEYSEVSGLSATHSWSSVSPDSSDNPLDTPDTHLDFTAIENRAWDAQAMSNASTAHDVALGYTMDIGNVTIYSADTVGSSDPLTTGYLDIGTYNNQAVANTEAGTACTIYLWVDIPTNQEPGAYVYTLTVQVTNTS